MSGTLPDALRTRLSYLLGSLHRHALDLETNALERLGIGVKHQAALSVLADEGPMTQQELGQRLGIDRTTIVALVDVLHDGGLTERTRNPADRRAYLLTLTRPGRITERQGRRLVDKAERDLLAALDDRDRQVLTDLLARAVPAPG